MEIYRQLKEIHDGLEGQIVITADIKRRLQRAYGTNPGSIIPSDYCYNRFNNGLSPNSHKPLFVYIKARNYRYVGNQFPYVGPVFAKPKGEKVERIIGEFKENKLFLFARDS